MHPSISMMQPERPAGHERQQLVDVLTSARGMFWKDHAESGQMYCTCVYSTHLMNRFSTSCGVVPTLSGFVVVLGKVDIRAFNFQLVYTCVFLLPFRDQTANQTIQQVLGALLM